MSALLHAWRHRGRMIEVFGRRMFVVTEGREHAAEPLLLLHGFPTSSFDFAAFVSRAAQTRPVVAFDHLGFGLSSKPTDYSYSLLEQAEFAVGVWQALGIGSGHLLAHDYGTSVATELLARRERGMLPIRLRSVTLCNGSVHLELARLTAPQLLLRSTRWGPSVAKLINRPFFHNRMRRLFGDPSAVNEAELEAMWTGVVSGGGRAAMAPISQYLRERVRFHRRWVGALERLDLPAHVAWGRADPIAVPAIASALAAETPGARLTWLDGLGHYPQTEDPQRFAEAVLPFVDDHDGEREPARLRGTLAGA